MGISIHILITWNLDKYWLFKLDNKMFLAIYVGKKSWPYCHRCLANRYIRLSISLRLFSIESGNDRFRFIVAYRTSALKQDKCENHMCVPLSNWHWYVRRRKSRVKRKFFFLIINKTLEYNTRLIKQRLIPFLKPEYVAEKTVEAVLTNQTFLIMPRLFYLAYFLKG